MDKKITKLPFTRDDYFKGLDAKLSPPAVQGNIIDQLLQVNPEYKPAATSRN